MKKFLLPLLLATLIALPLNAQTVTRTTAAYNQANYNGATFSALSANGSTAAFDTGAIMNTHTMACTPTGAPTTANMVLEGSMDSTSWYTLVTTQACTAFIAGFGVDKPARYIRATLSGLAGGTTPSVVIKYGGVR